MGFHGNLMEIVEDFKTYLAFVKKIFAFFQKEFQPIVIIAKQKNLQKLV